MSGLITNAKRGILTIGSAIDSTLLLRGDVAQNSIPSESVPSAPVNENGDKLRARIKKIEKEILPQVPGETSQQKLSWLEKQNKKLEKIIHRGRCEKKLDRPMPHSGSMVCLDEKNEDCTKTRVGVQYDYNQMLKLFRQDCKPRLTQSKS